MMGINKVLTFKLPVKALKTAETYKCLSEYEVIDCYWGERELFYCDFSYIYIYIIWCMSFRISWMLYLTR